MGRLVLELGMRYRIILQVPFLGAWWERVARRERARLCARVKEWED